MDRLLRFLLGHFIRRGNIRVTTSRGAVFTLGDGTGKPVAFRFVTRAAEWALLRDPELTFGESYMDGSLVVEQGSIADVLKVVMRQQQDEPPQWARLQGWVRFLRRRWAQFNPRRRSRQNVAHHYDLDGRLYSLFLDADRQYSCAYFETADQSLDDAQLAKKRHLAAKLLLRPGQNVLDIGCGWGGLALYVAELTGASVTGVTLSQEQFGIATSRAAEKHLSDKAQFRLQDYRDIGEKFDRIVSVGMFEHVGVNHYNRFFQRVRDLLTDDGVALIHYIGRSDQPCATNAFIARYIFPGGYIPALSEVMPAIERSGLIVTDIEILRLHYAMTLRHWRERFLARWDEAKALQGERFCRMWEFYLAGSEAAFRYQNLVVFQIQLSRKVEALPIVRDYMHGDEIALMERERALHLAQSARLAGE
jgi:cyclopropane-fatty-acyl-phospholipid synthase